jgi:hypothetical protein
VRRSEYEAQAAAAAAPPPDQWTVNMLCQWVADYMGAASAVAREVKPPPMALRALVSFTVSGAADPALAYAFRMRAASLGQPQSVSPWVFVCLKPPAGLDRDKAVAALAREFFPYIAVSEHRPAPSAAASRTMAARGSAINAMASPDLESSRKQVAASIANMKNWWCAEAGNYVILSDLGSAGRWMVRHLQTDIEALDRAFRSLVPPRASPSAVSVIRIFDNPAEYEAYVPLQVRQTAGVWMPDRKELAIRSIAQQTSQQQRETIPRIIYHEAFHQYVFYAMDYTPPAAWFNEGHAELFRNVEIRGREMQIKEDPEAVQVVQGLIAARTFDVRRLLALDHADFYSGDRARHGGDYASAWALVYYLRKAAAFDSKSGYAAIADRHLEALWQTRNAAKATTAAFTGIDLDKFQADLIAFWKSTRLRSAAERRAILR